MDPLSAAFADLRRAGRHLAESYVEAGTTEVLAATRRVVLVKLSAIALSAFAIGLSLYGLIFEATRAAIAGGWPSAGATRATLTAHATILAVFALGSWLKLRGKSRGS